MKKTKTIFWASTILFGGFMLFTAIPDILLVPEAVDFITELGYPLYIVPFLGIAKTLGAIALFIPGFMRIKEWAYAGLFFDLIGAVYSNIAHAGFDAGMLTLIPLFAFGIISYIYAHKLYGAN